jgi:hypothetical protein
VRSFADPCAIVLSWLLRLGFAIAAFRFLGGR